MPCGSYFLDRLLRVGSDWQAMSHTFIAVSNVGKELVRREPQLWRRWRYFVISHYGDAGCGTATTQVARGLNAGAIV